MLKRTLLVACLLAAAAPADAGLFVGVARRVKGLVVIDPMETIETPRRVVDAARVELNDTVRVAEESAAELLLIDGTTAWLDADGDYRVGREGVEKLLDGGSIAILPVRRRLESKSQERGAAEPPGPLGDLTPRGRPFVRRASGQTWEPLTEAGRFSPGDCVRCDGDTSVTAVYSDGAVVRLEAPCQAWLLPDSLELQGGRGFIDLGARTAPFTASASMGFVTLPRGAVLRLDEERGGCTVAVLKGSAVLTRKGQGPPASVRMDPGESATLTRAGVVTPSVRLLPAPAALEAAGRVSQALRQGAAHALDPALLALFKNVPAPARPSTPASSAKPVPAAPSSPSSPPPPPPPPPPESSATPVPAAPSSPSSPPSADGLEDLFSVPRLNDGQQRQARPR